MVDRVQKVPETGNGKITVGLKWPAGIILRVYEMVDDGEMTQQGYKPIKKAQQVGPKVRLRGYYDDAKQQFGSKTIPIPSMPGSFALTHNVDATFMAAWLEQNKDSDIVKNGLIIVAKSPADAAAMVSEREKMKCGIEPLDPEKPPPGMRGRRNMSAVQPDDGK